MPKFEQNDLVTTAEVASALGRHVRTVHRMVRDGRLVPALKVPGPRGALLFRRRDIERLTSAA